MSKHAGNHHGASQDGFTLIEMMIALLIVAMAAAVAMPQIGRQAHRADATAVAKDLQMMFFSARTRAVARASTETVDFDLQRGLVSDLVGRRTIKLEADLSPKLLIGREFASAGNRATVHFFPHGGSTGAKVSLGADRDIKVDVIVPWLTGIPIVVQD